MPGGGVDLKNARRGAVSQGRGVGGARGREGPGGCLPGIWGWGGAKYFFSGPKCPPS